MICSPFAELGVAELLRRALHGSGYVMPTPIQTQAIPLLLAGKDLFGIAQTGTGKTAAFALPVLQRLSAVRRHGGRGPSALILAPTRELAIQIGAAIKTYGRYLKVPVAVVFGGVGQAPQVKALQGGIDILVATPGRLLDLLDQGHLRLDSVSVLVLDEVDRMLDMGFIRDVRRIIKGMPKQRQTMAFSATMPPEIARLAGEMLRDPVRVEVAPAGTSVELVDQRVLFVAAPDKRALLGRLLEDKTLSRVLVFTRTKHRAGRVAEQLARRGISAEALHGNKSQAARQAALNSFQMGRVRVLVATDIAARGIDVEAVSHIINYELPNVPETYVHRIGRTARAGAAGTALSFCAMDESPYLRAIEKLTGQGIAIVDGPTTEESDAGGTAAVPGRPSERAPDGPKMRGRGSSRRRRYRAAA